MRDTNTPIQEESEQNVLPWWQRIPHCVRQTSPSLPSFCRDRAGSSSIQRIIAGPFQTSALWALGGVRHGTMWRGASQVEQSPKGETETDGGANDKHEVCGWSCRLGERGLEKKKKKKAAHFLKAVRSRAQINFTHA